MQKLHLLALVLNYGNILFSLIQEPILHGPLILNLNFYMPLKNFGLQINGLFEKKVGILNIEVIEGKDRSQSSSLFSLYIHNTYNVF